MSARGLSREELQDLGLSKREIEAILAKQSMKPVRRYKYIAFLSAEEVDKARRATGRDFVRATEYVPRTKQRP
jgi:hypothetical protein